MIQKILPSLCLSILLLMPSAAQAQTSDRMIITMVVASNEGHDFNLDNDVYRDKLMQLFSYSSYTQKDLTKITMSLDATEEIPLIEGYTLKLTLQEDKGSSIVVKAMITKADKIYIDTELSIAKPGVFFMGGPTLSSGDLILILENGY